MDAPTKTHRLGSRIALGPVGQIKGIAQHHDKNATTTKRAMQMMSIQIFATLLRMGAVDRTLLLFAISKEESSSSSGSFSNIHYSNKAVHNCSSQETSI